MAQNRTWTVPLVNLAGVPIRVHLTFLLLLALVAFDASSGGGNPIPEMLFIAALFGAVLAHELGHALAALRFGIKTRDITLYPFGGVASLLREAGPRAELVISAAGPLVNAFIAMTLAPWAETPTDPAQLAQSSFITKFFATNVVLVVFNLIPAFPMDGGRILRALLSIFGVKEATAVTVRISQGASVLLGLAALLTFNMFLVLVAAIVFTNSMQELVRSKALLASKELSAERAMIPVSALLTLPHVTTIPQAVDRAMRSFQALFPVVHGKTVLGFVDRQDLIEAAAHGDEHDYISGLLSKDFRSVAPEEPVANISDIFRENGSLVVFVMKDGELLGIILRDFLMELLLVEGLRGEARTEKDAGEDEAPF
jgi:Zn-dependent protease/CBS domain-containing protein